MQPIRQLEKFRSPLGGEEIELQQIDYDGGGMSLLRVRIRERNRFTVFDIDAGTAEQWGLAMQRWARNQECGANESSAEQSHKKESGGT